jgi:hypothetical protein
MTRRDLTDALRVLLEHPALRGLPNDDRLALAQSLLASHAACGARQRWAFWRLLRSWGAGSGKPSCSLLPAPCSLPCPGAVGAPHLRGGGPCPTPAAGRRRCTWC